jgi:hypothetical protein
MLVMFDDGYNYDWIELETLEQAAQDFLRIPSAEDANIPWSRSFPVQ